MNTFLIILILFFGLFFVLMILIASWAVIEELSNDT